MAQSLEAFEFPCMCEGASSLEESSVLSEEKGSTLIARFVVLKSIESTNTVYGGILISSMELVLIYINTN